MTTPCCTPLLDAPLSPAAATDLAARFKALADPTRLRLFSLLAEAGEACVCDLPGALGVSQPTVSHHLKVLAEVGLVEREKRGTWAYYRVAGAELAHLRHALDAPGRLPVLQ